MILTDDEIRKAAEFAAEQMWPESGYVGWTEDDAVYHRKFIEACFEKLRGGVEVSEPFGLFCGVRHDLPEDGELSDAVSAALDALNAVIAAEPPSSWSEGNEAVVLPANFLEQ